MLSDAPILRATFIILSVLSPLTACNLGTTAACHPDLLVLVFNLVGDLGYVVESRAILVIWFALATLAFAHVHLQVPLAGALDRATSNCLRASLPPMAVLLDSPFAQAILPCKRRTISMVDPCGLVTPLRLPGKKL